jgi:hypothetical protein
MLRDKTMKRNIVVLNQENVETPLNADIESGKVGSIANEELLENKLVLLFSEFDQHLLSLNKKVEKQPYAAISIVLVMLNDCAEFTENVMNIEPESEFLSNLANIASDSYSHLRLMHVRQNRISDATASNLYKGWTGEPAERHIVFKEISSGMVQILMSYLSFFSSSFNDLNTSNQWDDICEVFTDDLNKSLERASF